MSNRALAEKIEYRAFRTIKNRIKRRISKSLFIDLQGTVKAGPFEGMKLGAQGTWGSDTVAMLLGEYEAEVVNVINRTNFLMHDVVMDLGSADGYFAIGLAMASRLPVIAYESSERSRAYSIENATINGVSDQIDFRGVATGTGLIADCQRYVRPFILVDIEGSEVELFDQEVCNSLRDATLIVENHTVDGKRSIDLLSARLDQSHTLAVLNKTTRNPFCHHALSDLNEDFAYLMLSEERGPSATWACFTPLSLENIH